MPRPPRRQNRVPRRPRPTAARRQTRRAERESQRAARQAEGEAIEQRIAQGIADSLRLCAAEPERIAERLSRLDEERTLESALACACSATALGGILFGLAGVRRWLIVAALASGALLRETHRRDRPPPIILRRLGLRTAREIDQERMALRLLRGDFGQLAGETADELAASALKAINR